MRQRLPILLMALLVLLIGGMLTAPTAHADCGVQDLGACVDAAQYSFWYGWASMLWTSVDAPLLQAAYQIDVFRDWLVSVAFTSAYQVLTQLIDPLIVPFAIIALILGFILFALMPLFGRTRLMNLRHVLSWTIMVPLALTISGLAIGQVEQLRVDLGNAIFSQVSAIAPGAIFGVSANDMAQPRPLYSGQNPCGGGSLARPGTTLASVMHMDDLAAALLWANAQDIHCPAAAGPGQDIPDAFYLDAPDGPGFASASDVGTMKSASERSAAVQDMQRGVNRLALGILPALLAVGESLIQLLFALALIALWVGLPFALAFIFFEDSHMSVAVLFRQMLGVLKTSWFSSFLLAIVFAALKSSAEQGNATGYTAISIMAIFLLSFIAVVAAKTLLRSVETLNTALFATVGMRVTEPAEAVGRATTGAASLALGAATGGVALAATTAAAYHQTGSGRYAAGTAVGRLPALAEVGQVAAAMGWIEDTETMSGLHAGERSRQGGYAFRQQLQHDARQTDDTGMTFRDHATKRRVTRQLRAEGAREQLTSAVSDRWYQWQHGGVQTVEPDGSIPPVRAAPAAPVVSLDQTQLRRDAAPAALPADALIVPRAEAHVPRLLVQGYAVQQQGDAVVFWQRDADRTQAAARDLVVTRAQLRAQGVLTEAGVRAARPASQTVPAPPDPSSAAAGETRPPAASAEDNPHG